MGDPGGRWIWRVLGHRYNDFGLAIPAEIAEEACPARIVSIELQRLSTRIGYRDARLTSPRRHRDRSRGARQSENCGPQAGRLRVPILRGGPLFRD